MNIFIGSSILKLNERENGMTVLNHTHSLFSPKAAEQKAKELQENDSEWTYKAVHDPKGTGYSFIEIYDEDGKYVEKI